MRWYRYLFVFKSLVFCQTTVLGQSNVAPILTASGNQIYCPGTSIKIVTDFTIIDPDDTTIAALFVQISTDYSLGNDQLRLTGIHPNITSSWDAASGKLSLTGTSLLQPTYLEFIAAVKDIEFTNTSQNPSGEKSFSITIGQANYLPLTDHYYQFIPNINITWNNAKALAATTTYYGLQGYLATITSLEEAKIVGEQSNGAGWIGGSDEAQEGEWKWVTGPENGTVFWNGSQTGTTPNFAFWNSNEPNNLGNENYAHITAPGVGSPGSWNDLSNTGNTSGNYQPKGYIVEYGGLSGDPILQISASSKISIPSLTLLSNNYSSCGSSSFTLVAEATIGTVNWYDNPTGGLPIASGDSFTTPILQQSKTYYLDAYPINCTTAARTPIVITINQIPVVIPVNPVPICAGFSATLSASTQSGIIYWYETNNSTNPLFIGSNFITPVLTEDTAYFVSANNNGCFANSRIQILIEVNTLPIILDEQIEICENKTILLDALIPNYSYLWSTGAVTQTIQSTGLLEYTVVITSPQQCSKTKTFRITEKLIPVISDILINENSILIETQNLDDFQYSLDGINYQTSSEFNINETGGFVAFVKDDNECGIAEKPFIFIAIPKFFSPNNDGYNDVFDTKAFELYPNLKLKIFDRFGKFISELTKNKSSWDGTFNGNPLPADDYWYFITINDSKTLKKGHFSLKR